MSILDKALLNSLFSILAQYNLIVFIILIYFVLFITTWVGLNFTVQNIRNRQLNHSIILLRTRKYKLFGRAYCGNNDDIGVLIEFTNSRKCPARNFLNSHND